MNEQIHFQKANTYVSCDFKLRANTELGTGIFCNFNGFDDPCSIVFEIKSPLIQTTRTRQSERLVQMKLGQRGLTLRL